MGGKVGWGGEMKGKARWEDGTTDRTTGTQTSHVLGDVFADFWALIYAYPLKLSSPGALTASGQSQ